MNEKKTEIEECKHENIREATYDLCLDCHRFLIEPSQKPDHSQCIQLTNTYGIGHEHPNQNTESKEDELEWTKDFMDIGFVIELTKHQSNVVEGFIRSHFIPKTKLKEKLEAKKKVMAHIVGTKRVETPYVTWEDCIEAIREL